MQESINITLKSQHQEKHNHHLKERSPTKNLNNTDYTDYDNSLPNNYREKNNRQSNSFSHKNETNHYSREIVTDNHKREFKLGTIYSLTYKLQMKMKMVEFKAVSTLEGAPRTSAGLRKLVVTQETK